MAVSQAQHRVHDLYEQLAKRGIDVKFAIHPVAGRMPGHMNVLLAEAEIPYDRLVEMDDINPEMPRTDVALVIGANDVVNPAARLDKNSPIFGMPIIDADKAKVVLAIKRSMNPGFAGIENELYFADNTLMLFGDAKGVIGEVVKNLSGQERRPLKTASLIFNTDGSEASRVDLGRPYGAQNRRAARRAHLRSPQRRRLRIFGSVPRVSRRDSRPAAVARQRKACGYCRWPRRSR